VLPTGTPAGMLRKKRDRHFALMPARDCRNPAARQAGGPCRPSRAPPFPGVLPLCDPRPRPFQAPMALRR
jgi:hypothetical protein